MIGLEHVNAHAGRALVARAGEPADRVDLRVAGHPHRERRRIRPHELERRRPVVGTMTIRIGSHDMQRRAAFERHRAERCSVRARIVCGAIDQRSGSHARRERIAQLLKRHIGGCVLILPEVPDRNVPPCRKELAEPLVMVGVRMRQNYGINRRAIQSERIELVAKHGRLRSTVHQHGRTAVLDENRVTLSDVEHSNNELLRRGCVAAGVSRRR